TNLLAEHDAPAALDALRAELRRGANPRARMHALWALERREALDDATLASAARESEPGVRVHAMRILSERSVLPEPLRLLALAGLGDPDAFVRRAAADALGRHPLPANIRPLLELRQSVPGDDTHLLHVARMA